MQLFLVIQIMIPQNPVHWIFCSWCMIQGMLIIIVTITLFEYQVFLFSVKAL